MSRSFKTARKELLIFLFFIIFPILSRAEGFEFQNLFLIPGRVEGEGTYFEIKESEYLNVSLKSYKKVRVILESMPKLISLMIEESKEIGSEKANLIIENLEPNKIYYKYEDSYKNVAEVYSGNEGKYEWEQDLSKAHHIWFQEEKSTIFLPRDCSNYGNWDALTQTCILNQDLNQSVEIDENSITLDCANYSIVGNNEGYGIYLNSKTGVKIKNCKVRNFVRGLSLSSSNNNKFENNTFSNNETGIYLHASYDNEFRKNIIENNSWLGFTLDYNSQNNILRENQMQNNKFNFLSFGYENDIDTTNLVNGKPIYYLIDASNITLDSSSNAGTVHCIRCSNITLKDLNLKNNFFGIFLSNSKNLKIEGNKIEENNIGIYLLNSQGILVTENTILNNYSDIYLDSSNENLLEKNTIKNEISDNNSGGIILSYSDNNTLSDNNFFKKGIVIFSSSQNTLNGNNILNSPYGISITLSSENNILGNFLSENGNSIYLNWSPKNILKNNKIEKSRLSGVYFYNSSENLFAQNTLTENTIGIFSLDSAKNYIYHNNFINNQTQAKTNNQENFFDNGYPEGGNYWSDYTGVDEKSGQNQDEEGADGIGDSPYCFYNDCDQYPLMGKKEENLISQKWEFDVNFQYNLDGNLETIEGQGESSGEIFLFQDELKIEGVFSLNGNFPTQIPKISLISTDGFKKELSSSTISFNTISYFQAGPNSYHFSLSISNPPRPENNGHYELYLEIEGTPFFINTNSKINKNYLPLIVFKNQPPTPIIEFFPKSPVKGTKVKFDGAKSFDFDGEIVNFEWQIASTTFYGTTTEFTFNENGEYQIT
jgi:parallel beta-helix repeat protein